MNDNDIELYDDIDDEFNSIDDILSELPKTPKKRNRRKSTDEYYVKGADLIEEIKKYQISKREDAEKRGVSYEERHGQNVR